MATVLPDSHLSKVDRTTAGQPHRQGRRYMERCCQDDHRRGYRHICDALDDSGSRVLRGPSQVLQRDGPAESLGPDLEQRWEGPDIDLVCLTLPQAGAEGGVHINWTRHDDMFHAQLLAQVMEVSQIRQER